MRTEDRKGKKTRTTSFLISHERNGHGYRLLNETDDEEFVVVVVVVLPSIICLDSIVMSDTPQRFPRRDVTCEIREYIPQRRDDRGDGMRRPSGREEEFVTLDRVAQDGHGQVSGEEERG